MNLILLIVIKAYSLTYYYNADHTFLGYWYENEQTGHLKRLCLEQYVLSYFWCLSRIYPPLPPPPPTPSNVDKRGEGKRVGNDVTTAPRLTTCIEDLKTGVSECP